MVTAIHCQNLILSEGIFQNKYSWETGDVTFMIGLEDVQLYPIDTGFLRSMDKYRIWFQSFRRLD